MEMNDQKNDHNYEGISIIIPARNEENRIEKTLEEYDKYFKGIEIFVEMDGCRDNTLEIVKNFSKNANNQINYLSFEKKLGKGGGLLEGFKKVKGNIIAIVDADGSVPPSEIDKLIKNLDDNCHGTIGSRWIEGSIIPIKQPLRRRIASRCFNIIVRNLFGINFKDTQCGAKVFKKEAIDNIIKDIKLHDFAFDIDLLYQLNRKGYYIKEIPILWYDKEGSNVKLFRSSIQMFFSIIKLKIYNSHIRFLFRFLIKKEDNIGDDI